MLYIEYIIKPLHNLLLWFVGLVPGHSLVFGLMFLALFSKIILFIFIYHGHLINVTHHHIQKHVDNLYKKHKNKKDKFEQELHILYQHYQFNPWKGIAITFIQFIILFAILNFLYADSIAKFSDLSITTMSNVFMPTSINFYFDTINLLAPLSKWWGILLIGLIQFFSLEIFLLSKRKIYKQSIHEEHIEHVINIVIAGVVAYLSTKLPAAMAVYWLFFILFGIIRKIIFDKYIDNKIIKKLEKIEKKVIKKEEPKIKRYDENLIFYIWKLFHLKSPEKNFVELKKKVEKKLYALHHKTHLYHSQRKLSEEPHIAAILILFI